MDARTGVRVAWVCYQARAYDLACTLFLAHLGANKSNIKYLAALESAADKCNRLPEVVDAYRNIVSRRPASFTGALRSLTRRGKNLTGVCAGCQTICP